jgi:SAM-dependent methyltransferase
MPLHVLVEDLIHGLRYKEVLPHLKPCGRLADLGSGDKPRFLRHARSLAGHCWGLDPNTVPGEEGNVTLSRGDITKPLPFEDGFLDQITCLAVIEHIENPLPLLKECLRCLKSGGGLIITTPTRLGIQVHELIRMAGLVRDVEEGEHHDFFMSKDKLSNWARQAGFIVEKAYAFELGMNLLLVARKP